MTIKIGFLASGNGTSVRNILENIKSNKLKGFEGIVIITNKENVGIYDVAKEFKIPIFKTSKVKDQLEIFKKNKIDLVLALGYIKKIGNEIINYYKENIWNIHPALLPKHGGKGMHGINVHKSVIENGDKITGATIHIVNENYDEGRILSQIKIKVLKNESAEKLQKRVLEKEYELMIETLKNFKKNLPTNCRQLPAVNGNK